MKLSVAGRWCLIGVIEGILSLGLIAIAPVFLNSTHPLLGFLIWLSVIAMLGASCLYVIVKLKTASQSRKLFLSHFPDYQSLKVTDFLGITPAQITRNLDVLTATKDDPDFQDLGLSLFNLLKGLK